MFWYEGCGLGYSGRGPCCTGAGRRDPFTVRSAVKTVAGMAAVVCMLQRFPFRTPLQGGPTTLGALMSVWRETETRPFSATIEYPVSVSSAYRYRLSKAICLCKHFKNSDTLLSLPVIYLLFISLFIISCVS